MAQIPIERDIMKMMQTFDENKGEKGSKMESHLDYMKEAFSICDITADSEKIKFTRVSVIRCKAAKQIIDKLQADNIMDFEVYAKKLQQIFDGTVTMDDDVIDAKVDKIRFHNDISHNHKKCKKNM